MSNERNFLIRFGLHSFVTRMGNRRGKADFEIKADEGGDMVRHASHLIRGGFGEHISIQAA